MRVRNHDVVIGSNEWDVRARPDDEVSLVDHDGLAAVADVLDDVGVLTARLTRGELALPRSVAAQDAMAIGEHVVDGQTTLTIAHHFPDADPEEQLEDLRTMWESIQPRSAASPLQIEIVDSGTDGAVAWLTAHLGDWHVANHIQNAL